MKKKVIADRIEESQGEFILGKQVEFDELNEKARSKIQLVSCSLKAASVGDLDLGATELCGAAHVLDDVVHYLDEMADIFTKAWALGEPEAVGKEVQP